VFCVPAQKTSPLRISVRPIVIVIPFLAESSARAPPDPTTRFAAGSVDLSRPPPRIPSLRLSTPIHIAVTSPSNLPPATPGSSQKLRFQRQRNAHLVVLSYVDGSFLNPLLRSPSVTSRRRVVAPSFDSFDSTRPAVIKASPHVQEVGPRPAL
jgi:hypothetical protein